MVHFVEFVYEKNAGSSFVTQRSQQWPFRKEIQRVHAVADLVPFLVENSGLRFQEEFLQ